MQRILIGSSLVILCAAVAAAQSPPGTTPGSPGASGPGTIAPGAVAPGKPQTISPSITPQTVSPSIKKGVALRQLRAGNRPGHAAYTEPADAKSLAVERHRVQYYVRPQHQQLQDPAC